MLYFASTLQKKNFNGALLLGLLGLLNQTKGEKNGIFREGGIIILIQSPSADNKFWLYGINHFL